tara:strand:- start:8835 stop:9443 length:609 start_codon:yes stop_codon:yes gene_type:complete
MLCIIDINIGNTGSVAKSLRYLGYEFTMSGDPKIIAQASKIIFPGVGSFSAASEALFQSGLFDCLIQKVIKEGTPILGICVGMQMLATTGYEHGQSKGLDFIDAEVNKLNIDPAKYRIPHVGWNDVSTDGSNLYCGIKDGTCFYFVHSYEMKLNQPTSHASTDYGKPVVASIHQDNIYGVQFHPEKSQGAGLQLLKNFIELC